MGAVSSLAMASAANAQQAVFGSVNLDASAVVTIDQAGAFGTNASLTEVMQITGVQDADGVNDEMLVIDTVTGYVRKQAVPTAVSNAVDVAADGSQATITDTAGNTLTVAQTGNDLTIGDGTDTFTFSAADTALGTDDQTLTGNRAVDLNGNRITFLGTSGGLRIDDDGLITLDPANAGGASGETIRNVQGNLNLEGAIDVSV